MEASDWLVFLQHGNELSKPPAHWIQSAFPGRAKMPVISSHPYCNQKAAS